MSSAAAAVLAPFGVQVVLGDPGWKPRDDTD